MHVGGDRHAFERHHERRGERPRLGAEVFEFAYFDADFLFGFAPACVLQVFASLHESGRNRVQAVVAPCAVVLQQQTVIMVDDRGDHRWLDSGEQQTIAILIVRAVLSPAAERRFDGRAARRAVTLPGVPHAERDGGGCLSGFACAGVGRESAQVHPVESGCRAFQQRFRVFLRFMRRHFGERVVRSPAASRRSHNRRIVRLDVRHVHGDDMLAQSSAVRAEEYGERRWVRFEFRGNVRARQLGEAHFHVGVVGDGALAVRHGHFAVFDEDDFRCRFRQDFGEQVGFAASCHFVVDVSLGEWQERQGLRQCQW